MYRPVEVDEDALLAPRITSVSSADLTVTEGDAVRVDVRVRGRPLPQVSWALAGRSVAVGAAGRVRATVGEGDRHTLFISKAELSDQGLITCVARNRSGEQHYQCNLKVIPLPKNIPPAFVEKPQSVRTTANRTVTLIAAATGAPTPSLTWIKVH